MKKEIIASVTLKMRDTNDPIDGAVFEKTVDVDFATFCAFVLTQWDSVTMETVLENKTTVYLFYNGTGATDHVASFILPVRGKPHGVFGGSRVGSKNTNWNDTGKAFVKNAFKVREA